MDIEIRPAQSSDVDETVPLIYSSGEHEYDYGFATARHRAIDFIRVAFLSGSATESYRGFQVVVVGGQVVGTGSFLGGGVFDTRNTLRFFWEGLRFFGVREFWGVARRGLRLMSLMPTPDKDALFIQKLGVTAEMRGKGIGTALMSDQIQRARTSGYRRCVLDVAATNLAAQRLYERLGFHVTGEQRLAAKDLADVLVERRMELVL